MPVEEIDMRLGGKDIAPRVRLTCGCIRRVITRTEDEKYYCLRHDDRFDVKDEYKRTYGDLKLVTSED